MHDPVYMLSQQFPLSGAQWYTFVEMRRQLLFTQPLWVLFRTTAVFGLALI